jgi:hypothetical protein
MPPGGQALLGASCARPPPLKRAHNDRRPVASALIRRANQPAFYFLKKSVLISDPRYGAAISLSFAAARRSQRVKLRVVVAHYDQFLRAASYDA